MGPIPGGPINAYEAPGLRDAKIRLVSAPTVVSTHSLNYPTSLVTPDRLLGLSSVPDLLVTMLIVKALDHVPSNWSRLESLVSIKATR